MIRGTGEKGLICREVLLGSLNPQWKSVYPKFSLSILNSGRGGESTNTVISYIILEVQ